ncbi:hypothetical protein Dsin_007548 [Dipteronia sinensis]|uniref:FAR1 domain-containing protein n=1 Tax=Dipteronia sinensis TaxID=43782 RepID=A0AAE0B0R3_9ROSI|nr:hypothetical protein Dsin_007548 [Dipteronia sinensis]
MDTTDFDWKPRFGMEFDSDENAYEFYNSYGRRMRFGIRRDTVAKNKHTGEITSRIFVCCKEGFRPQDERDVLVLKYRAETRTSCEAKLCIKLDRKKYNFFVNHFV